MPGKYGDVGHFAAFGSDIVFMVVAPPRDPRIRTGAPDIREVLVLAGTGYIGGDAIPVGNLGPLRINDPTIEWLTTDT